jgi:hypothetical protein
MWTPQDLAAILTYSHGRFGIVQFYSPVLTHFVLKVKG